jgi:hypothetical protein
VIAAPPSEDGACQDRLTWASPAAAVRPLGAPGAVTGATGVAEAGDEGALCSWASLTASTVKE